MDKKSFTVVESKIATVNTLPKKDVFLLCQYGNFWNMEIRSLPSLLNGYVKVLNDFGYQNNIKSSTVTTMIANVYKSENIGFTSFSNTVEGLSVK